MSLVKPCSLCRERKPGKDSNVTYAWYRADQKRVAHRATLCIACFVAEVAPYGEGARSQLLMCPSCGTDSSDDLDANYITVYLPGQGKLAWELATCGSCAAKMRIGWLAYAEQLPDRPQGMFGGQDPGPQTETGDPWAALGLRP